MSIAPSLPFGGSAVMAGRHADDGDGLDYFPTPPWAARAGGELIRAIDPLAETCWEPACGGGHMVHGLRDYFDTVSASDLYDYGAIGRPGVNFLEGGATPCAGRDPFEVDWIVTNPPFVHGEAFFRLGWARASRGVAMLLRLAFIESAARYRLFNEVPLTVLAPFSERVPMVKGRWDPEASSATAYAWFICAKTSEIIPPAPEPVVRLIPPGTKARLQRDSDLKLFGPDRQPTFDLGAA